MQILVDAAACPVTPIVEQVVRELKPRPGGYKPTKIASPILGSWFKNET